MKKVLQQKGKDLENRGEKRFYKRKI